MSSLYTGKELKERRLVLGLTQQELADGIMDPSRLSRIENGRETMSRDYFYEIMERLGLYDWPYGDYADEYTYHQVKAREQILLDLSHDKVSCMENHIYELQQYRNETFIEENQLISFAYVIWAVQIKICEEKNDSILKMRNGITPLNYETEDFLCKQKAELIRILQERRKDFEMQKLRQMRNLDHIERNILNSITCIDLWLENSIEAIQINTFLIENSQNNILNSAKKNKILAALYMNQASAFYIANMYGDSLQALLRAEEHAKASEDGYLQMKTLRNKIRVRQSFSADYDDFHDMQKLKLMYSFFEYEGNFTDFWNRHMEVLAF